MEKIAFYCDNKAAKDIMSDDKVTKASKSVAINILKIKQTSLENEKFKVEYVPSKASVNVTHDTNVE